MPRVPFERYADDIVCHCRTEREAQLVRESVAQRFSACGLMLHPQKTKLVYCKDSDRKAEHAAVCFDSSATHSSHGWRSDGDGRTGCHSYRRQQKALKAIRRTIGAVTSDPERQGARRSGADVQPAYPRLDRYYGHFYKSVLYPTLRRIDAHLIRWVQRKFKRLRQQPRGARTG